MSKSSGFTLIELLVVIAILAILSTIGFAVFSNVQAKARDAKRIMDIDNIAKSLETSKDYITGKYYNKLSVDFPDGIIPTDPKGTTSYCICIWPNTTNERPDPSGWSSGCPTNWSNILSCDAGYFGPSSGVVNNVPFSSSAYGYAKSWKVCAKKESNDEAYCKHNFSQ